MATTSYEKSGSNERTVNGEGHVRHLQECAQNVKGEIEKVGTIAKQVTEEKLSELQKKGSEQLERVSGYAKERPLTALAAAVALGFFGAVMLRRSS